MRAMIPMNATSMILRAGACGLFLALGACAAETSAPETGADSADVVARSGITKAKSVRNASLAAVGKG